MSDQKPVVIRSVLIPLQGMSLLLPNVAIAEVVAYSQPTAIPKAPEWVKGMMSWRGQRVPLLSFERLAGKPNPPLTTTSRIAILNRHNTDSFYDFLGLVVQGIPRLLRISQGDLQANPAQTVLPYVLCTTQFTDETALIPDLESIEKQLQTTIK